MRFTHNTLGYCCSLAGLFYLVRGSNTRPCATLIPFEVFDNQYIINAQADRSRKFIYLIISTFIFEENIINRPRIDGGADEEEVLGWQLVLVLSRSFHWGILRPI